MDQVTTCGSVRLDRWQRRLPPPATFVPLVLARVLQLNNPDLVGWEHLVVRRRLEPHPALVLVDRTVGKQLRPVIRGHATSHKLSGVSHGRRECSGRRRTATHSLTDSSSNTGDVQVAARKRNPVTVLNFWPHFAAKDSQATAQVRQVAKRESHQTCLVLRCSSGCCASSRRERRGQHGWRKGA